MLGKLEKKVSALKDGDGSAFDQIYEQTNRSVYFAALYIVHEKMAAEDVMQETYIKAIRSIHLYRPGTNFVAWICSIARNLALNHLRKYSREMSADMESEPYKYGTTDPNIPYIFDIASRVLKEDEYEIVMLCQVAGPTMPSTVRPACCCQAFTDSVVAAPKTPSTATEGTPAQYSAMRRR